MTPEHRGPEHRSPEHGGLERKDQGYKAQVRMRGSPVWRSQLFRAAIFYTALFSFSTMLMFAYAWWTTSRLIENEVAQVVEAELRGLAAEYRAAGTVGLIGAINRRISADADPEGIYLLVEPDGMRLTGNLASWPANLPLDGTWISFRLLSADGRNSMIIGARAFILEGGLQLLVGRNLAARTNLQNSLLQALAIGLSASLVLGACGGIYSSRRLLKRVSAIGAVSQQILEGDLTRRLPRDSSGDEFDRLAEQLNRMLERLETLVGELRLVTDSLAHDLRAPLTRLRSRLEESLSHPGGEREAIESAIEEADHLLVTFRALLDIARAEAGALGDEQKPLDLALLLQETAELFEPVAEDQGVTLTCTTESLKPLRGHRQLLAQAIANLIENALKFTPSGGHIALSLKGEGGMAVITVADSGPGIAPEDRDRVLQRFVRLDASRSSPGSGLGLSLVAAVTHLHESTLALADNAPGLKVTWRFPLSANQ